MSEPKDSSVETQASELLKAVTQGERFIWLPPGGVVAAAVIPSLCPVSYGVGWLLIASVSRLGTEGAPLSLELWAMGVNIALLAAFMVPQVMVYNGRAAGRVLLLQLVRWVSLLGVGLSMWALTSPMEHRRFVAIVCLTSLVVPNLLVQSKAYLTLTCYMSLKRKWELEHKARVDGILAQGRKRRGKRR